MRAQAQRGHSETRAQPSVRPQQYASSRANARGGLPFGWGRRVVFHAFFPMAYAGYCEAVPVEYEYLLPPMAPGYDKCLFGDRLNVFDCY